MGCWYPLQRAINAGLIIVDTTSRWAKGNEHLLFRNERARQLFNLRQELLHGNPGPEQAEQLVIQIEALRAEQTATWLAAQPESEPDKTTG